jgi:hypothetical protein
MRGIIVKVCLFQKHITKLLKNLITVVKSNFSVFYDFKIAREKI